MDDRRPVRTAVTHGRRCASDLREHASRQPVPHRRRARTRAQLGSAGPIQLLGFSYARWREVGFPGCGCRRPRSLPDGGQQIAARGRISPISRGSAATEASGKCRSSRTRPFGTRCPNSASGYHAVEGYAGQLHLEAPSSRPGASRRDSNSCCRVTLGATAAADEPCAEHVVLVPCGRRPAELGRPEAVIWIEPVSMPASSNADSKLVSAPGTP